MVMDDDVLEFNFEGVEPATFGVFTKLPKGEYNLQVVSCEKFYAKTSANDKTPDPNKPGLHFVFSITNHPTYEGIEQPFWQMLGKSNEKFLLNTLMCLIPEYDWKRNGIKIPMAAFVQKVVGRPCNGMIEWKINEYEGKRFIQNNLEALKPYDQGITQPVATEGNPPTLTDTSTSTVTKQASAGVSSSEVDSFLSDWPGGPAPATTPTSSVTDFGFGDEPF